MLSRTFIRFTQLKVGNFRKQCCKLIQSVNNTVDSGRTEVVWHLFMKTPSPDVHFIMVWTKSSMTKRVVALATRRDQRLWVYQTVVYLAIALVGTTVRDFMFWSFKFFVFSGSIRSYENIILVTNGSGANMQGMGYIEAVPNVYNCAKICAHVDDCAFVSYRKTNHKCYLKTADAIQVRFCTNYYSILLLFREFNSMTTMIPQLEVVSSQSASNLTLSMQTATSRVTTLSHEELTAIFQVILPSSRYCKVFCPRC